ncbi:class I SAM-dependent methyltransferase [Bradyrhizobium cajani]|uniref:Methyltransferase domain-containing protein n=1 Tax=Bradyrhizobium cajani TaxID=1928661 RepID=A0A844T902_9BRAD|nr:class I SAM-dependent methyltransferase [Bradyrhizobium cajani]MCP3368583.1 class I SAM-dependent methyltransferase [Bradyrhizobium cajani]MVT75603.1 methyltransferase domain-containing protein [Bradyrhizobium cajani]
MSDYYSPVAEFYDLVARAHGEGELKLRERLRALDPAGAPILDIGAGTGRTTLAVAETVPDVEILAVEPAPAMRAVLMHMVARDPDLARRVTVLAEPVEDLTLPERLGAVIAYGVLGHLDLDARQKLWRILLPRLSRGAPIFVELLPIEKPMRLPTLPLANATIGRRSYIATLDGEPGEGDIIRLTSTWVVSGGPSSGQTIRNTSIWHTFGLDDLAQETGLRTERLSQQAGVLYA